VVLRCSLAGLVASGEMEGSVREEKGREGRASGKLSLLFPRRGLSLFTCRGRCGLIGNISGWGLCGREYCVEEGRWVRYRIGSGSVEVLI